jgi:prophage antirepressor-like protein
MYINEPALYSLIFGSRKEEAKRFKRWVCADILPSIRRTGGFGALRQRHEALALALQRRDEALTLALHQQGGGIGCA